ncbi:MAG TPA: hypothetical protein VNY83_05195 [Solirubrobacterales bacterium]|jgi:hypothetical protein|nr:hypothetical protein [Solirubrobacterales bacterium]
MPGGQRTDRISQRDLEVLEFIARFGVVPRSAVAVWAGTGRTVTIVRESRLCEAGLIRVLRGVGESGPLAACTAAGLRASGRVELRTARFSAAAVGHDAVVASLAARMERSGERLLSEREILARERAEGKRVLSAALSSGRFHRADLVRVDERGEPREAIEVELSTKGAARLDELLRAWRRAVVERRLTRVVYRCPPQIRCFVEQAIERTRTAAMIEIEELER